MSTLNAAVTDRNRVMVPVGYQHPKWAMSAVSACFAFLGGGLGVGCKTLGEDDTSGDVTSDVNEAANVFFKRSKELSLHMSKRFGEMMRMVNEQFLHQYQSGPNRSRHYSPPLPEATGGGNNRLSPLGPPSPPKYNPSLTSPATTNTHRNLPSREDTAPAPARELSPGGRVVARGVIMSPFDVSCPP